MARVVGFSFYVFCAILLLHVHSVYLSPSQLQVSLHELLTECKSKEFSSSLFLGAICFFIAVSCCIELTVKSTQYIYDRIIHGITLRLTYLHSNDKCMQEWTVQLNSCPYKPALVSRLSFNSLRMKFMLVINILSTLDLE